VACRTINEPDFDVYYISGDCQRVTRGSDEEAAVGITLKEEEE
jgi:hypothetical protein